jgi:fatty acid desaturase
VSEPEPRPELKIASPDDLARAISNLSDDEAAFVLDKLERALRKRKIQITGYLIALAVWLIGTLAVLAYLGTHPGKPLWLLLAPFGLVGAALYGFGLWAERVSPSLPRKRV